MYTKFIKPAADRFFALFLLVGISPLLLGVIVILGFSNKGNIFFKQKRPGKYEKIFIVLKFKTMNDKKDNKGNLLADKERLHKIGLLLRKTSLDEIPQLFNVLKGDMSFVGPRPLLVEYLPFYTEKQRLRHSIKPGITGWAQINGRNAISWEDKFNHDIWYVKHKSFVLDIKILFLTFFRIVQAKDVNKKNTATTTKFKGNTL
ncbi:sugar transferase [Psychroflexus gondwanensis]|uniref:sugar transferase n=1 Tax=Psychroflexus gondwanensis TaxID=251 RepID=UPI0011BF0550|nr:sugar transferase [Psychroflexus gondwanensis]TXE19197.1 sugar transferase [Psychroflexus gondwanensis]